MTATLLVISFATLAALFTCGARDALTTPRPTEREIESYTLNAIYDVLKALCVGGAILLVGLCAISILGL